MSYKNLNIKVALGLSGGVDSSVAAYLLKKDGYDITCVYMQCWDEKGDGCTAEEDRASAASVAGTLGLPFKHLNFVKEYKEKVISSFYDSYSQGLTPNPDILCNKEIKFGMFYSWAVANGYDFVATGHYAKVCQVDRTFELHQPADLKKDQTYFLHLLSQDLLGHIIFPLQDLKKDAVRNLAKEQNLHTFNKPDSQGICFIGNIDIRDFLKRELVEKEGNLVFKDGTVIGKHKGAWFYTVGQRHGFLSEKYFGLPLYVISKDVKKNEVIVGFANDVLCDKFPVKNPHWINDKPSSVFEADVRVRNLGKLIPANVVFLNDDLLEVSLSEKEFGVASGQSAVFYEGTRVMGGGVIV